jgi:hypothetical protein
MASDDARTRAIKQQVADEFASDRVTLDEVVLKDNGDIVIDRRRSFSWAKPVTVGRWR